MTVTAEESAIDTVAPARLTTTSMLTVYGHLSWLAWLWVVMAIGFAIAVTAISIWGSLDQSLWEQAVAGWQRWPIGAAGVTVATVLGPMFVTNGVTRARLAQSATVSMIALSVLGSIYVTVGFAIESVVFEANDWTHRMDDIRFFDEVGLWRIAISFGFVFAAYFVGGWILGLAFERFGWFGAFAVPLAAAPVVVCEAMVMLGALGTQFDVLDRGSAVSLWTGTLISGAVTAGCVVGAARWTRELPIA